MSKTSLLKSKNWTCNLKSTCCDTSWRTLQKLMKHVFKVLSIMEYKEKDIKLISLIIFTLKGFVSVMLIITGNNFLLSIFQLECKLQYAYQQRVLVIEDWYQEDHLKDEAVQKHHRVEESTVYPTKKNWYYS